MAKKFNLDPLITHTMKLDKINEAVEFMKTGKWQVLPLTFMSECLGQGKGVWESEAGKGSCGW